MNNFFGNVGAIIVTVIIIAVLIFVVIDGVLGFISHQIMYRNDPPAIEVYRGNTTLEITYRDGIPVDSVVVYKSK